MVHNATLWGSYCSMKIYKYYGDVKKGSVDSTQEKKNQKSKVN